MGIPPPGGMMARPMPVPIKLIKLNKPELKTAIKMRAFVWKRVVLDRLEG